MTAPSGRRLAWPAIRTLATYEWRLRWRGLLVLGIATGIFAGTSLAIASVLWRTDTAYDRLVQASRLDDLRISTMSTFDRPDERPDVVRDEADLQRRLSADPAVVASQQISVQVGRVEGPGIAYASIYAPEHPLSDLATPVLIEGRAPADYSPDEVMLEETRARDAGLGVGDFVSMDLLTAEQFQRFSTGIGEPAGGHVDLHIVGIFRYPQPRYGFDSFVASPVFYYAHINQAAGVLLLLATKDHQPAPAIVTRAQAADDALRERYGPSQTQYVSVSQPRANPDPSIGPTRAVLQSGLLALTVVVAVAGFLLTSQLAGRWAVRGRYGQDVENALGLRPVERLVARMIAAVPAIVLIVVLALSGGLLGGLVEPLGALDRYEPDPGWLPRPDISIIGTALVVLIVVLVLVVTTLRAGRTRRQPARRRVPWWAGAPLRPVPLLAGCLASARGGTRTAIPARSMIVGLAAMLAALVVVGEVHTQLAGLAGDHARWGWTADFGVADDTSSLDEQLVADPRVQDLDKVRDAPIRVRSKTGETLTLSGYGRQGLKGSLDYTIGSGRLPREDDEVAIGPRLMNELHVRIGDTLAFDVPASVRTSHVVGVLLLPSTNGENLGEDVLFTAAGLRRVATNAGFSSLLVHGTSAAATAALRHELNSRWELLLPTPPASVAAIDELTLPTRVLLLILTLAALLLVAQNTRLLLRRRGGQLAVIDAMGLPRRAIVGAASSAVLISSVLAALLGLPFGWAVSRIVLVEVGPRLGLILHAPGMLTLLAVGGLVVAASVAVSVASTAIAFTRRHRTMLEVDG